MTAAESPATPTTPAESRRRYLPLAVAASVVHMLLMLPGYNEDGFQTTEWLAMLAFSLVVSLLVFAFVVPRGGALTALVLGVVGLLAVLVFWAGLTLPLAAAGAVTGWRARRGTREKTLAIAAVAVSAVAAVALVAVIVADAAAN